MKSIFFLAKSCESSCWFNITIFGEASSFPASYTSSSTPRGEHEKDANAHCKVKGRANAWVSRSQFSVLTLPHMAAGYFGTE
jgi:hypothetical protein